MILGTRHHTLRRYEGAVTYDERGEPVYPSAVDGPLRASVQPADGEALETLPEGERTSDAILVMTRTPLRTGSQFEGTRADEVIVDGVRYQVRTVKRWPSVLPHYECVCTRVDEATP